jgi:hypothetical protein
MTSDRWAKVHTAENIFEMDTLKAALEKEGIDFMVKEHRDTAYDGLFMLQKGFATFYTREEDEPAARAIIKGITILPHVVLPED